jgi:hypothetical protein
MQKAAEALRDAMTYAGSRWVYLKGGRLTSSDSPDLLFDGDRMIELPAPRLNVRVLGAGDAIAAALAAGRTASPAAAQRGDSPFSSQWDRPREERAPQRDVPLSDVLRDLRSRYGGQHLDARKVGEYYIIAWMTTDGRRLNIRVNAATGREE